LLVSALASLLTREKTPGEIILLDDASDLSYQANNMKLAEQDFIVYYHSEVNKGRSISRRQLAELAKYEYLLFLDCDIKIISPEYISRYAEQIKHGVDVCSGGLVYDETEPDEHKYKLHWHYGTHRESRKSFFLSSNFLVRKNVFLELQDAPLLNQYGHEDTLWGILFKKNGRQMQFIDNPVQHEGVEEVHTYIKKSLQAVENLLVLENLLGGNELAAHVKLYEYYKKFEKYHLTGLVAWAEKIYHKTIMENLAGYSPSLKYFDWLRLAHFIRLKKAAG
jgi:glycosyltransferase involved in cell wall biosynthesis